MSNTITSRSSRWLTLSVMTILALLAPLGIPMPAYGAADTVTVNFALYGGTPTYRASGFIYGLAQDASTPPQTLLSQIKVKFIRHGGSQIGCPNGGWVNGQYTPRWNSVKAYYAKAQAVGATYIMLLSALWGSDGVCNVPRWPGDNGNWTEYTNFMTQVINDAKANGMTGSNVRWDIWNEPNIFFWGRSQSQYLEMWKRGYQMIRAAIPNAVIEGPSYAGVPASNTWWNTYLDYIKANNVVPNYISWHDLPGDPVADATTMNGLLSSRGISVSGYSINEYGAFGDEQQPGPSAWYIARLERANGGVDGARANWGMVGQTPSLYDTMGWLVTANANQPMGQWWIYKRYADQTGLRTNVTPGSTHDALAFQDSSAKKSITLVGCKAGGSTGTVAVVFNNIPSWLIANGTTNVLVERMPSTNAYVSAPIVVSNSSMAVSGSSLTVNINWSNCLDAYAITLTPGSGGVSPTATPQGTFPVPGTYYRLINRNSGKVADVANCGTADGTNVRQWTSLGNTCQQWRFESAGDGYYYVINRNSGKCLDVEGISTADGANVFQWTCWGGDNQKWQLVAVGSYYGLRAKHSGKALDVNGCGTANGVNIQQWTWLSNNCQQWTITP